MGENADRIKQGYEAFGRGDLDAAVESFAEDIRWENPESDVLPQSGVFEGKDRVKQMFADFVGEWESFEIVPDEFIEGGDNVVVLSHGTAKGSGGEVKLPWAHIWRMRDGQAVEVLALTDTALAAQALGKG
jgi:ketosteroid isomerase-like protein